MLRLAELFVNAIRSCKCEAIATLTQMPRNKLSERVLILLVSRRSLSNRLRHGQSLTLPFETGLNGPRKYTFTFPVQLLSQHWVLCAPLELPQEWNETDTSPEP